MAHVLNVTLHATVCTICHLHWVSILEIVFCNIAQNLEGIMSWVFVGFSVTNKLNLSVSTLSIAF